MIKKFDEYFESVRDLMKPKSEEELEKVWQRYWDAKKLLHETYPANAYAVMQSGGLIIHWNEFGKVFGYGKTERLREEIIELLKGIGLISINRIRDEEIFRIR
jgi:hypothetical protein